MTAAHGPRARAGVAAALLAAVALVSTVLLASSSTAGAATPWVEKPASTYAVKTTAHLYSRYGTAGRYDAFVPVGEPSGLRPMVLVVPGTRWELERRDAADFWARDLATRGYVAFGMSHRLATAANGRWAAQREDVESAVAAIRRGASVWGGDPRRITVLGSSTGGTLALHAGRLLGVTSVVAWSPTVDFYRVAYTDRASNPVYADLIKYRLLRCTVTVCRSRWASTRPLDPVRPTLIVASQHEFIDPAPAQAIVERQVQAGLASRIELLPGSAHGGEAYRDAAWAATLTFLHDHA